MRFPNLILTARVLPAVTSVMLALAVAPVHATLIDLGQFTRDTESGLEWLDLTETNGLSFDDVAGRQSSTGALAGWRHASRAEVVTFWEHAGGQGPFAGEVQSGGEDWVGTLLRMWGITYPFTFSIGGNLMSGSVAMTADSSPTCPGCNLTVYLLNNMNLADSSSGDLAQAQQLNEAFRNDPQVPIGHALVRAIDGETSQVPEPSTVSLVLAPLLLQLASRARRSARMKG